MSEILYRAFASDLELRAGGDGRTITGLAVPFGEPAEVNDPRRGPYTESFVPGAFTRTIAQRGDKVKLFTEHSHQHGKLPIGKATLLREDARGLYGEFRVSQTRAGDEALELTRDGALDGLSVGFRSVEGGDVWEGRSVTRREVALLEVSLTGAPVYAGAGIEAIRHDNPLEVLDVEDARARLAALRGTPTLSRTEAYTRLACALEATPHAH